MKQNKLEKLLKGHKSKQTKHFLLTNIVCSYTCLNTILSVYALKLIQSSQLSFEIIFITLWNFIPVLFFNICNNVFNYSVLLNFSLYTLFFIFRFVIFVNFIIIHKLRCYYVLNFECFTNIIFLWINDFAPM